MYSCSCCWCLLRCKTASNQHRIQPQPQAGLRNVTHRLPGEVRHWNIAAFIHGHGHFGNFRCRLFCHLVDGRILLRFALCGKIDWREIVERCALFQEFGIGDDVELAFVVLCDGGVYFFGGADGYRTFIDDDPVAV